MDDLLKNFPFPTLREKQCAEIIQVYSWIGDDSTYLQHCSCNHQSYQYYPRFPRGIERPIGGKAMGHAVTYGVRLSTHLGGLIHYATILHSPYHHQKDAVFYIREKGLEDD